MASYRVLVVEDNHEVRRMVTASLKTLGEEIDVLDVPSAEEALVISASLPLDLVVLDFRLPGMTGIDMVARLRKRRPEAKIILVTGVEDASIRQKITEAGAEAYFFKPIEIDKFLEAVRQCLWAGQPEPGPETTTSGAVDLSPSTRPIGKQQPKKPPVKSSPSAASPALMPALDERLVTLKQQLHAVSVLLVNDAGQVMEVAGNPSQITSGSALLTSLMHAFRASLQVTQALGRGSSTSLQYFATQRQCLYVAPVGMNHALFVITSGYFESDKLGTIDRYFQLAVRDLQDILANLAAEQRAHQVEMEKLQSELPAQAVVDDKTRQLVDDMFTQADQVTTRDGAENFWESMGEEDSPVENHGKDILSYDQAQDLGLAPPENKPS